MSDKGKRNSKVEFVQKSFWLYGSLLASEGKRTCIIIYYVQVFIVSLRLAHAAQLGDINQLLAHAH